MHANGRDRAEDPPVPLRTVLVEWGRLGCLGFGGPPTHISLLRALVVERRRWISSTDFEDALAACNLLPGPASTQLAIYCGHRVAGRPGALLGGLAFIGPGLVIVLGLAALFLSSAPPTWVRGSAAGAGAAVAAVALHAGVGLIPASWRRPAQSHGRWLVYAVIGGVAAATAGPFLVLVLLGCGLAELGWRQLSAHTWPLLLATSVPATGGLLALAWVALKVGALSYGGGFVIIPIMQADAVDRYGWMTSAQFLDAVALGQITPGPVTHTIAVVGYAASGLGGGLLAATIAFAPSFLFVLAGATHFDALRRNGAVRAFLDGAGPAAVGAILGVAVPLALALAERWQYGVLAGAAVLLLLLRRSPVMTLLAAAAAGVIAALLGAPLP
jgi:chromate transporter